MFTWGAKYLFGIAAAAFIGAFVYGLVTGGDPVGVVSGGYKGGVGDHLGYALLLAVGVCSLVIGIVAVVTRDGDADAVATQAGLETVPETSPPTGPSYWGAIGAFGVACLVVGVAVSTAFLILGLAVLFVVGLEWLVLAWSDRATGDPEINAVVRQRVMRPIEIPMLGSLLIAVVVVGLSRVFLAASAEGAVVAGVVAALFVFVSATVLAHVDVKRGVVTGVVVIGAIGVLAGGIVSAIVGERDFHHHEVEGEDHSDEGEG